MGKKITQNVLATIIDSLAPLNNELRLEKNSLIKIEKMWELGKILDFYLNKYDLRLHELLFKLYDPHSTVKASNITRDLGSYSYRVYKYFNNKGEIQKALPKLISYSSFRESIPLLFNTKYQGVEKKQILELLNSSQNDASIKNKLVQLKQKIRPIRNPRTQKANLYNEENKNLQNLIVLLKKIYLTNKTCPEESYITNAIGSKQYRSILIPILMVLANDIFINKLENYTLEEIPNNLIHLFKLSKSESANRSRFRKWVLSTNKLLTLAEGIEALNSPENYSFYRKKYFDQ